MGHSIRRTPVLGYANSEKTNKVAAHRKLRRVVHALEHDTTAEVHPVLRDVSSTRDWQWRKSPRHYNAKLAELIPKLMRK